MGAIKLVWGHVGTWLGMLVGVWNAPPWLRWCNERAVLGLRTTRSAVRQHPRLSTAIAAGVIAAGFAGYHTYAWWQARPKPVEVSLSVSGPALTDFANGAAPQGVVVSFNESVAALSAVGKVVETGITVSPAVEGSW